MSDTGEAIARALSDAVWASGSFEYGEFGGIHPDDVGLFFTALSEAGYVVVPKEPTEEMYEAFGELPAWENDYRDELRKVWCAMLSASTPEGGE